MNSLTTTFAFLCETTFATDQIPNKKILHPLFKRLEYSRNVSRKRIHAMLSNIRN